MAEQPNEGDAAETRRLENLNHAYRPWLSNWLLILTACFALIWIVHRAMVQAYRGSVSGMVVVIRPGEAVTRKFPK